ncbi:MAG: hypothetical protein H6719_35555 [Sandaracinaceae bacterium]|nr:hypothetical protein [Sandaracinaceae bacterium]
MTGRLPLALVAALLVSCSGASTVHPEYSAAEGRAGGEAPDQAPPPEEAIPTGRLPEGVTRSTTRCGSRSCRAAIASAAGSTSAPGSTRRAA